MSEASQQRYDVRRVALVQEVNRLPDYARRFVEEYRRPIELCGRAGDGGCQLDLMERFVADVRALLVLHASEVAPGKVLDLREHGSGL